MDGGITVTSYESFVLNQTARIFKKKTKCRAERKQVQRGINMANFLPPNILREYGK